MKATQQAYDLIRKFEGLRLISYKATPQEKYYTIGYGHTGEDVAKNFRISKQVAEELLLDDVAAIERKLFADSPNLSQRQFDALVSFIYNVGWYSYRYSMTRETVRQLCEGANQIKCARRICMWVRSNGIILKGLQLRRVAEANFFLGYNYFKYNEIEGKIDNV